MRFVADPPNAKYEGALLQSQQFWVGLDAGEVATSICVLGDDSVPILECVSSSSCHDIAECLADLPQNKIVWIALEAGASHGMIRGLIDLGFPVLLLDASKVSRYLSIRLNKTDSNDARGLAEIAQIGAFHRLRAHVRSRSVQQIRDQLRVRHQLVIQRTASRNALRSALRNQGSQIRRVSMAGGFAKGIEAELADIKTTAGDDLASSIRALLDLHQAQSALIEIADKRLARIAAAIPVIQRFREIPGVGPMCAISFYSVIEDPFRFPTTASVGAYLGLVPKIRQSGLGFRRSRISRAGDTMTRGHLAMAAGVMLSRAAGDSAIKDWGRGLAVNKGYGRARIAVARKLAIAMLSIWKSGEHFCPYPATPRREQRASLRAET